MARKDAWRRFAVDQGFLCMPFLCMPFLCMSFLCMPQHRSSSGGSSHAFGIIAAKQRVVSNYFRLPQYEEFTHISFQADQRSLAAFGCQSHCIRVENGDPRIDRIESAKAEAEGKDLKESKVARVTLLSEESLLRRKKVSARHIYGAEVSGFFEFCKTGLI